LQRRTKKEMLLGRTLCGGGGHPRRPNWSCASRPLHAPLPSQAPRQAPHCFQRAVFLFTTHNNISCVDNFTILQRGLASSRADTDLRLRFRMKTGRWTKRSRSSQRAFTTTSQRTTLILSVASLRRYQCCPLFPLLFILFFHHSTISLPGVALACPHSHARKPTVRFVYSPHALSPPGVRVPWSILERVSHASRFIG
jgi:hypothetical protein